MGVTGSDRTLTVDSGARITNRVESGRVLRPRSRFERVTARSLSPCSNADVGSGQPATCLYQIEVCWVWRLDITFRSSRREVTPSFVYTFRKCHSTVRGLRNSCAPISGFDSPSRV